MMIRGKDVALSLLAVGTAAVAGYLLRTDRARAYGESKADVGARIVDEVPSDASVIDVSSDRLATIPGARRAIDRAISNDALDEWEHVTIDANGAWEVVDRIRGSLPYYDADSDGYNGVYVRYGDRVVVVDAIGWARLEEPLQ